MKKKQTVEDGWVFSKNKKGEVYLASIVSPPPTRKDILRSTIRLELSMRDGERLKSLLVAYTNTTHTPFAWGVTRDRILKQLKREGVK